MNQPNTPDARGSHGAIQVPSPDFWTVTPFGFTAAVGWTARETADHLVYATADDDPRANLGIRWRRTSANIDLRVAANVGFAATRRIDPEAVSRSARFVRIGGVVGYVRLAEFMQPDSGDHEAEPVRTAQMYVVLPGPMLGADRPRELFELAAHFPAADATQRVDEVRAMIGSFHFRLVPAGRDHGVSTATLDAPSDASLVDDIADMPNPTEVSDAR